MRTFRAFVGFVAAFGVALPVAAQSHSDFLEHYARVFEPMMAVPTGTAGTSSEYTSVIDEGNRSGLATFEWRPGKEQSGWRPTKLSIEIENAADKSLSKDTQPPDPPDDPNAPGPGTPGVPGNTVVNTINDMPMWTWTFTYKFMTVNGVQGWYITGITAVFNNGKPIPPPGGGSTQ